MICPEFRGLMRGAERADSLVFNPHKWLFTHFDCSAHFVRDPKALTDTLGLRPSYLRTLGREGVTDYNEWSVPLGRRFRALKLWFVIRSYGVEELRAMIRRHVAWAEELAGLVAAEPGFAVVTAPVLSLFSFRYEPAGRDDLDDLNLRLVERLNDDGRIYLTQTRHRGRAVIRFRSARPRPPATTCSRPGTWCGRSRRGCEGGARHAPSPATRAASSPARARETAAPVRAVRARRG